MNIMVFKQLFSSWRNWLWIVLELVALFVLLYLMLGTPLSYVFMDISHTRGHLVRKDVIVVPANQVRMEVLASYPGVKECEPVQYGMFPFGRWYNGAFVGRDSASMVHCHMFWRPETKAVSDMIGYEYVYPEEGPDWDDYGENSMMISSDLAEHFFGSPEAAVGSTLLVGGDYNISFEIEAVIKPLKFNSRSAPASTLLLPYYAEDGFVEDPYGYFLSLYDGVDPEEFVFQLNRDLKCKAGTYADMLKKSEQYRGVREADPVFIFVFLFIVFNILLSTLSFFYLRIKVRMDEVGIRLACGASHRSIMRLFIKEGLILALLASLIGMAIAVNITGYTDPLVSSTVPKLVGYVQVFNTPLMWYLAISLVVMLILAVISVISSVLTSSVLMKVSVSDAFREE